jgi:hypothetical protein
MQSTMSFMSPMEALWVEAVLLQQRCHRTISFVTCSTPRASRSLPACCLTEPAALEWPGAMPT